MVGGTLKIAIAGCVLAAACGRVGYDAGGVNPDGSTTSGPDADPSAPDANNDIFPVNQLDVSVTGVGGEIERPNAVWNGNEFALVWSDESGGGIQFSTIGVDGATIIAPKVVANGSDIGKASLVWTGTGYALAWKQEIATIKQVFFATLDANGEIQAGPTQLTNTATDSKDPRLRYFGSTYCLAWEAGIEGSANVFFNWLDSAGVKQSALDLQVSTAGDSTNPSIACDASGFDITWEDDRSGGTHAFTRSYDSSGIAQTTEFDLGSAAEAVGNLAAIPTGTGTSMVWHDGIEGSRDVYYRHLNTAGVDTTGAVSLTAGNSGESEEPALVSIGTDLALAWVDTRDGNAETYFNLIDESGNKLMTDMRITNDSAISKDPIVAGIAGAYAVLWVSEVGTDMGSLEMAILTP
jgi:hypothetical protein